MSMDPGALVDSSGRAMVPSRDREGSTVPWMQCDSEKKDSADVSAHTRCDATVAPMKTSPAPICTYAARDRSAANSRYVDYGTAHAVWDGHLCLYHSLERLDLRRERLRGGAVLPRARVSRETLRSGMRSAFVVALSLMLGCADRRVK